MQRESDDTRGLAARVIRAFRRARWAILSVALTYTLAVSVGAVMVHSGSAFALAQRDRIVGGAQASPTLAALHQGDRLRAAVLDFAANLFAAAADTLGGLAVVIPFPIMAYRGWVGGVVSVDGAHLSRLREAREAAYYLTTLVLQLIPYSVTGGAGVNLGLAFLRPRVYPYYQGDKWWELPKEAVRDVGRLYLVAVPLFLLASLFEFLAR